MDQGDVDQAANPLVTLVDDVRTICLAIFALVGSLFSFVTRTIPHACFAVVHYSWTLQLNFPSLLLLFGALLLAVLFWFRHRNRSYARLKEVPLKTDDGFNLHPELNPETPDQKKGPFHTYLDDFLQAIRVFGFLEKPVFHELARHLQTRRLLAGDSLSLDSDYSFYIVIDGNVQVFAPLPPDSAARESVFDDEEHTGYQLLNEVGSGGTLSSLFTILSLFTEEVQLGVSEDSPPEATGRAASSHGDSMSAPPQQDARSRASSMRPGSEQLQLNAAALRNVPQATNLGSHFDLAVGSNNFINLGASSEDVHNGSVAPTDQYESPRMRRQTGESEETSRGMSPIPSEALPPAEAAAPFNNFLPVPPTSPLARARGSSTLRKRPSLVGSRQDASHSPSISSHRRAESVGRPQTPASVLSGYGGRTHRIASISGQSTGATGGRPSDTLHYEGVGTIGRATVDTTLAVIPAEAFKRLTKRYPNSAAHIVQVILTRLSRVTFHTAHKYLGLTKEVMRTEKRVNEEAGFSLPSSFYEQGGMETLRQRFRPEPRKQPSRADGDEDEDDYFRGASGSKTPVAGKPNGYQSDRPARTPWGHPDLPLRTPMQHTSVAPGDLFSMAGSSDIPRAASPGWAARHKASDSKTGGTHKPSSGGMANQPGTTSRKVSADDWSSMSLGSLSGFDLKDEILQCISKSIGLHTSQPASPSLGPHEASPFINAQDAMLQRSVFNSAFSSLSMLDNMMLEDEASSVTGGSSMPGIQHPAELDNEIEIRFFLKGSTLAKAGESHAGLFYVIDGFLDVIVPAEDKPEMESGLNEPEHVKSPKRRAEPDRGPATTMAKLKAEQQQQRSKGAFADASAATSGDRSSAHRPSRFDNALDGTKSRPASRVASNRPIPPSAANKDARSIGGEKAMGPLPDGEGAPPSTRLQSAMHNKPIYSVGRGGIAGYLSSLLGSASYVDVKAKTDVYVGYLPAKALERIMEKRPFVLLTLSKRLLSLLSPLIIHIDSALDWQQVNAGQVIFREGDTSDSFYIVINGRLRAISDRDGSIDVLSEYGQGDSVGELDVITASPRRKTLHAIRDSELARMPMTLFNAVAVRHPQITIQISRIIARRVRQEMENKQAAANVMTSQVPGLPDLGRNNSNLRTVAILPVTREVPIAAFASRLQTAFEDTIGGPTAFLNQSSVMSVLGRHAFNRMGKLKLAGWLADQEQRYRLVLYVVDTAVSSPWAQTSIRQADSVLLVGFGDDPAVGEYERLLQSIKTTARKELVLLHPERSVPPGSTREWLKPRPWIQAHHHVEMPNITRHHAAPMTTDPTAVKALRNLKERLETRLQQYRIKGGNTVVAGRPHHFSDFARLARRLTGKSIGLVLGGGGARGCAHVGVLQALEERGVPIDMIGGTSIGSLIGGLYAKEGEVVSAYGRAKKFSGRMASLWRFASDLTYPVVSYTTGHEFNRGIFKALSDTHIEDMWLPFFCNSVNITLSRMEVHTSGYAWRYIRASMTLAGLIPPLVDEGNMLVDGGYVDNLPVSVMLAMGAKNVFAVDVGSIDDTSPRFYGDTLSGWWVLLNKWNPWSDARNIPSIPDIQGRLTYVSSVKTLEEAKRTPGCRYMRMPVEGYGTLQFGQFTEISKIGYAAAAKFLDEWGAEGLLPSGMDPELQRVLEENGGTSRKGGISARRNSV